MARGAHSAIAARRRDVRLRRRGRRVSWPGSALALSVLVAAPAVLAQQAPGEVAPASAESPQPASSAPPDTTASASSAAPSTAADARYHEAFALLARGD